MAGITDIIEEFLKASMLSENQLQISRNQLAQHFACAPSQINYVLTTRFSPSRGYIVESKRGGSGYITIVKIERESQSYLDDLLNGEIGLELSQNRLRDILENMVDKEFITKREKSIIFVSICDKTLPIAPIAKDSIRAMMFKNIIKQIIIENGQSQIK